MWKVHAFVPSVRLALVEGLRRGGIEENLKSHRKLEELDLAVMEDFMPRSDLPTHISFRFRSPNRYNAEEIRGRFNLIIN